MKLMVRYAAWASPKYFYMKTKDWLPYLAVGAIGLLVIGMFAGLVLAPPDYQQGDGFRIIYIHVPSAFLSMGIYMMMATFAFISLVWRIKLAAMWMKASSEIGAWFTFLALITGSIWGKPMWGTWWIWDARLTSVLILLFLYWGIIALQASLKSREVADKAGAILVLVGVINIPIIHYSVVWWNTLHQGATLARFQKPAIDSTMLYPLLIMIFGFFMFYLWVGLMRVHNEILRREKHTGWLKEVVKANAG